MKGIDAGSIDMVLADPPYGITACKWDSVIPLEPMWEQLKRVIKPNGAIVMTASQPFTSVLVTSYLKGYKHHWIWIKERGTGFQCVKYRPMMRTEDVIMFCKGSRTYNPQMIKCNKPRKQWYKNANYKNEVNPLASCHKNGFRIVYEKYPTNVLFFKKDGFLHPTQKPVPLFEYLIKTYTHKAETVLDFCIGSGTTAIACINTGRQFIGIEKEKEYFDMANKRIKDHTAQLNLIAV